jgi:hypothetical protein
MKKIYISLMLVLGLGLLSSCDMDKKPFGSIDETTAIQHVNDLVVSVQAFTLLCVA